MFAKPLATQQALHRAGPAEPDEIAVIGAARRFARDQEIFGEGDSAELVYKVVSGAVRSFRVLADGRRQIGEFHLPGDVFGVELDTERRSAAEAVGETVLVAARRSALAADPAQGPKLWRHALRALERSQDHVLTLGRRSASERVASFLVALAERTGGGDEVQLPMSRQDIADYLGLTIETVSRTLTQLQGAGLISLSGCRGVRLVRRSSLEELCQ
jgi:CRP/FNR family nitrogen fixation transcriptional regulator